MDFGHRWALEPGLHHLRGLPGRARDLGDPGYVQE